MKFGFTFFAHLVYLPTHPQLSLMTTVTLSKDTAVSDKAHKTSRAEQRETTSTRVQEERGDYRPSSSWAPQATTDPQQQWKNRLPFVLRPSQHEKQRIPAEEQPFTVESNGSSGGDLPSWWGSKARSAPAAAAAAARRPSSPFQSNGEAFQQQEPVPWSESPAPAAGGGGVTYNNNNSGQMMAKAGYMPFDNEDRLGIFDTKRGGFDQQASPAAEDGWRGGGQQHSPAGSGVSIAPAAAASGLDAWPSTYSSEISEAWTRQPEEGGQQGLRQVRVCGMLAMRAGGEGENCAGFYVVSVAFLMRIHVVWVFLLFFFMSPLRLAASSQPPFFVSCLLLFFCLDCHTLVGVESNDKQRINPASPEHVAVNCQLFHWREQLLVVLLLLSALRSWG